MRPMGLVRPDGPRRNRCRLLFSDFTSEGSDERARGAVGIQWQLVRHLVQDVLEQDACIITPQPQFTAECVAEREVQAASGLVFRHRAENRAVFLSQQGSRLAYGLLEGDWERPGRYGGALRGDARDRLLRPHGFVNGADVACSAIDDE